MMSHEFGQIEVDQGVAVQHDEWLAAEEGLRLFQPAACSKNHRLVRIANVKTESRPVTQLPLDQMPEVMEIDDHFLDAMLLQQQKIPHDKRASGHRQERL